MCSPRGGGHPQLSTGRPAQAPRRINLTFRSVLDSHHTCREIQLPGVAGCGPISDWKPSRLAGVSFNIETFGRFHRSHSFREDQKYHFPKPPRKPQAGQTFPDTPNLQPTNRLDSAVAITRSCNSAAV
jgi:hypothetical protein